MTQNKVIIKMRALKPLILIVLLVAGGHGAYWMYISKTTESYIDELVKTSTQTRNIENVTYTIKKSGYPAKVQLDIEGISMTADDVDFKFTTPYKFSVGLENPFRLIIEPQTIKLKMHTRLSKEAQKHEIAKTLTEIDMSMRIKEGYVQKEGERLVSSYTIGKSTLSFPKADPEIFPSPFVEMGRMTQEGWVTPEFPQSSYAIGDIENIVINLSDKALEKLQEDSKKPLPSIITNNKGFKIDRISFTGTVKNLPQSAYTLSKKMSDLGKKLEDEEKTEDPTALLADMKQELLTVVGDMEKYKTVIDIPNIGIEISGMNLVYGIKLSLDDEGRPEGYGRLYVTGINSFADAYGIDLGKLQGTPVDMALRSGAPIDLKVEAKDGALSFNGFPLAPVPPLKELFDKLDKGGMAPIPTK